MNEDVKRAEAFLRGIRQKGVDLFWLSELRKKAPCDDPIGAITTLSAKGWKFRQYESNQQVYEIEVEGDAKSDHRASSPALQSKASADLPKKRIRSKKSKVDGHVPAQTATRLDIPGDRAEVRPGPQGSIPGDKNSRSVSKGRTLDFFRPDDDRPETERPRKRAKAKSRNCFIWRWEVNIEGTWFASHPVTFSTARKDANAQAALGRTVRLSTLTNGKWKTSTKWKRPETTGNGPLFGE